MPSSASHMIKKLQPAGNLLQGLSFKEAVAMLVRPYTVITETQYQRVKAMAERSNCDAFRVGSDGPLVTFGEADDGYALMPIAE
ncbi:hypothetical protein ACM8BJ_23995 [Pseudomonas aeruginosa]|nr:hypothetical protein [Pseudomonas aeruginosa]MDY1219154.1 hypothetical protein [Pseudomonas aeruginosa]HBP6378452.1 hypothetical protein [Pseudomonas aeruginosa]